MGTPDMPEICPPNTGRQVVTFHRSGILSLLSKLGFDAVVFSGHLLPPTDEAPPPNLIGVVQAGDRAAAETCSIWKFPMLLYGSARQRPSACPCYWEQDNTDSAMSRLEQLLIEMGARRAHQTDPL